MTRRVPLIDGWSFRRLDDGEGAWAAVELPHSPFIADDDARNHWFGECEYRRAIEPAFSGGDEMSCFLFIGAAMHTARVYVDEEELAIHRGGYLPFEVDLTMALRRAPRRFLRLRLDNRDAPDVPPGKPFEDLDFCWYGGLYRDAELRFRPAVHITDPVAGGEIAGGGVFIRTVRASGAQASLLVRTHVRNSDTTEREVCVRTELKQGRSVVARALSRPERLPPGGSAHIEQAITIDRPALWSHLAPQLHEADVTVLSEDGAPLDARTERFGVRTIRFSRSEGFVLNGQRVRLRGTNRHQEMPRVGYAVPRAAQYRDARRIKEAGFDYVRLSHYPQAPEFLDACDELGIVVMNCLPGWQYLGGHKFREACYQAARELIRRDRNHPCVVLWELSLNETAMDDEFMTRLQAIGHEEYPGGQMFTAGWIDRYDVFIHSRQHGRIHSWRNGDKALVVAEYGDWEFYARNEGFDQKTGAGVFDRWSTSRQFRGDGEQGLRQQVANHILALNDTLSSPAALDGQWAMFDYARGYDPVRAAVGVMDLFRLPKFSYHFYRSQLSPHEQGANWNGGPTVFIASHWLSSSDRQIWVFSNCEEVELRLNGTLLGRNRPAQTASTQHLPHPPFRFEVPRFQAGTLEARGFVAGKQCGFHSVATPGSATQIELVVDDLGIVPGSGECDVLIAHAQIVDAGGTLCVTETSTIRFSLRGAELVGPTDIAAEAGIASVVIRLPSAATEFVLAAELAAHAAMRAELRWDRSRGGATARPPSQLEPALLPTS